MNDSYDTGPRAATTDSWDGGGPTPQRPMPVGESWNSLLFGAIIFAVAGFYFAWSTAAAAQFAM